MILAGWPWNIYQNYGEIYQNITSTVYIQTSIYHKIPDQYTCQLYPGPSRPGMSMIPQKRWQRFPSKGRASTNILTGEWRNKNSLVTDAMRPKHPTLQFLWEILLIWCIVLVVVIILVPFPIFKILHKLHIHAQEQLQTQLQTQTQTRVTISGFLRMFLGLFRDTRKSEMGSPLDFTLDL